MPPKPRCSRASAHAAPRPGEWSHPLFRSRRRTFGPLANLALGELASHALAAQARARLR